MQNSQPFLARFFLKGRIFLDLFYSFVWIEYSADELLNSGLLQSQIILARSIAKTEKNWRELRMRARNLEAHGRQIETEQEEISKNFTGVFFLFLTKFDSCCFRQNQKSRKFPYSTRPRNEVRSLNQSREKVYSDRLRQKRLMWRRDFRSIPSVCGKHRAIYISTFSIPNCS